MVVPTVLRILTEEDLVQMNLACVCLFSFEICPQLEHF